MGHAEQNPRMPTVAPRGFRIVEAALYMGASAWFVERMIRGGRLPALRLGRHYSILKEDMDSFLDEQKKSQILGRL
jgi:excisionase family DNA binding protein